MEIKILNTELFLKLHGTKQVFFFQPNTLQTPSRVLWCKLRPLNWESHPVTVNPKPDFEISQ